VLGEHFEHHVADEEDICQILRNVESSKLTDYTQNGSPLLEISEIVCADGVGADLGAFSAEFYQEGL
jgi:hypothetical protein